MVLKPNQFRKLSEQHGGFLCGPVNSVVHQGREVRKKRGVTLSLQCNELLRFKIDIAWNVLVPLGAVPRRALRGQEGQLPILFVGVKRQLGHPCTGVVHRQVR